MPRNKKNPAIKTHQQMIKEWMKDSIFRTAYDALESEYQLLHEMLAARKDAGLTQAEVAKRMGTKAAAVARLEASLSTRKHSPSLSTLQKYAKAVDCKLEIHLQEKF